MGKGLLVLALVSAGVAAVAQEMPPPEEKETLPEPRQEARAGLTLDQVISQCLMADPKIRSGVEAIRQASADLTTASLAPNPQLFTDIQLLPLFQNFTPKAQGGPPQQDVQFTFPIDWFVFGKRAAAKAAALQGVRVSEAQYADLVRRRVLEAILAYHDVLEADGLLDVAELDVSELEKVIVASAKRPPVERTRARLDLLRTQRDLRDAESTQVRAKIRLRALLGDARPGTCLDVVGALDLPEQLFPMTNAQVHAAAVEQRPDIQALHAQIARAQASIVVEKRNARPAVAPTFGYTRQYQSDIGFPDANSWSAAVAMSLPFCNRNQGNRAKAESLLAQSHLDLESALIDLSAEIDSLMQELQTARSDSQAIRSEQVETAARVRDLMKEEYEKGDRPLLDVLDALRDYQELFKASISSRANYWRAYYKLSAAMGQLPGVPASPGAPCR